MNNALEKWLEKNRLYPTRGLSQLEDTFDKFFSDFKSLKTNGASFTPSCDITEDAKSYTMKFDLPGVSKDQVKVEIDGDRLMVTAERKEEKKQEDAKKYLSEISYGSYMRSFTLPAPIDEKLLDAKFKDGVLTVIVPKTESSKAKQIPVQ